MSRMGLCTFPNSEIIKITENGGILVFVGGTQENYIGKEIWLYKDMIHDNSEIWKEGHKGDLVISVYYAQKKGLI